jgi:hypothetical protein
MPFYTRGKYKGFIERTKAYAFRNRMSETAKGGIKSFGVRHHQKTKRAFCKCGKYNELYREEVSKAYAFETSFFN